MGDLFSEENSPLVHNFYFNMIAIDHTEMGSYRQSITGFIKSAPHNIIDCNQCVKMSPTIGAGLMGNGHASAQRENRLLEGLHIFTLRFLSASLSFLST